MKKEIETNNMNYFGLFRHYLNSIESVMIFINELEEVIHNYEELTSKKQVTTINQYYLKNYDRLLIVPDEQIEDHKKNEKVQMTEEDARELFQAIIDCNIMKPRQKDLLFNSSFVFLISHFQYLFTKLLFSYFSLFPEFLSKKSINIKFEELQYYNDINEIHDMIIEKSVEEIMYKPFQAQIDFFEKTLKINCGKEKINWDKINEAFERRNIVIHNNNIVNEKYLSKTKSLTILNQDKKIELNSYLSIDKKYFNDIFNELIIAGTIIHHDCWMKWNNENFILEIENAKTFLFDFIKNNEIENRIFFDEFYDAFKN